jgi:hypothetical protein
MESGRGRAATAAAAAGLLALLCSSLLLNALFLAHYLLSPSRGLSWALQAAREAEVVAAEDCSGHGQVFLDGVTGEDGRPGCECNAYFTGPDSSQRDPNCTADAKMYVSRTFQSVYIRSIAEGAHVSTIACYFVCFL